MGMTIIDAKTLKKAFLAGAQNLEAKKEWINELNVFPVPDGDTLHSFYKSVIMIIQRKHPFQSGCSKFIAILSLWTLPILWFRQDRHFYFCLFLFLISRKASRCT